MLFFMCCMLWCIILWHAFVYNCITPISYILSNKYHRIMRKRHHPACVCVPIRAPSVCGVWGPLLGTSSVTIFSPCRQWSWEAKLDYWFLLNVLSLSDKVLELLAKVLFPVTCSSFKFKFIYLFIHSQEININNLDQFDICNGPLACMKWVPQSKLV